MDYEAVCFMSSLFAFDITIFTLDTITSYYTGPRVWTSFFTAYQCIRQLLDEWRTVYIVIRIHIL